MHFVVLTNALGYLPKIVAAVNIISRFNSSGFVAILLSFSFSSGAFGAFWPCHIIWLRPTKSGPVGLKINDILHFPPCSM